MQREPRTDLGAGLVSSPGGTMAGMDVVVGEDGLARPAWADGHGAHGELLRHYYDTEWGMPVRDERGLFERLSLEAFQSGLSWATILAKREAFRAAFAGFDPDVVATYGTSIVATVVSLLVAYVSIAWLLKFVANHSFAWFAAYRIPLGLLVMLLLGLGVLQPV